EVLVRLPRDLSPLEERVRGTVQSRVSRGRVEVSIMRDNRATRVRAIRPDTELAAAYTQALTDLARVLGIGGEVTLPQIASFPDVIKVEEPPEDVEGIWPLLSQGLDEALSELVVMREAEGARLTADLRTRLERIEARAKEIESRATTVVADYSARLRQRITELLGHIPVDEQRLVTEVAVFAERSDISEEITRLRSHVVQFREDLSNHAGAIGRKLEFVLQEMGREANTIGSKANDLEIGRAIIAIKGELESLREQVQNLE
ncbi:MAG TPA: YicC/YloC family endoribonuclease, partial [bacterium]|nr:YicC/YloC family endoribonuclease [bacterium]